jgi:hypothetical protein
VPTPLTVSMPSIDTLYPRDLQNLLTRANIHMSNLVDSEYTPYVYHTYTGTGVPISKPVSPFAKEVQYIFSE